jgi:hypothetical protein
MLLAALVVTETRAPERIYDCLFSHAPLAFSAGRSGLYRRFERRQSDAGVTARSVRDALEQFFFDARMQASEPALFVRECAAQERHHVVNSERFEREDAAARQQRADDLEGWILRRRAYECDRAVLDGGQQRILLRLIEAMNLVHEENRPTAFALLLARLRDAGA